MGARGTSKYSGKYKKGDTFGSWTVVDGKIHGSPAKMNVKCVCGKKKLLDVYTLVKGKSTSCGCQRVGESAPNWQGINGISATALYRQSQRNNLDYEVMVRQLESQYWTCPVTSQSLTADNSVCISTTALNTEGNNTSTCTWVHQTIAPAVQKYGLDQVMNTVAPKLNRLDQLGFSPTQEKK